MTKSHTFFYVIYIYKIKYNLMAISTEIVTAFITGLLGPVLVVVTKKLLEKKEKPDMVKDTLQMSELVVSKIEKIREELDADRVWITQFHNGGHYYPTGKSIAKFSMLYETVGVGVSSVQSNFQNIPVNLFSKSINELLSNDIISISDFKDETIATFGLKYIAEDTGCKSGYIFSIKTIDGKFIGSLGVDFTKNTVELNDDDILHLSNYATSIGGVLMNYLSK
jgi:hypothetical protein